MPIDAGIYGQIQQPQQQNPLNALAQAMQIRGAQYQIDKAGRDDARQNKLLSVLQSPEFQQGDTATRARLAYGAGDVEAASKITTAAAAANKDQRAADVSGLDMKIKQLDAAANIAGSVTDQASYERGLGMMQQLGFDTSKFAPQYNPEGVRQFAMATLSAKERLANQTQMRGQDITRQNSIDTNNTSASNNANTVGAALRGQDLTDARSRETVQNGRIPSGYRPKADGTGLEYIPGGPADPNTPKGKGTLTDSQGKALSFGARMQEAGDIFDTLDAGGTRVSVPGSTAPYVGGVISALQPESYQKLDQAKRNFINAVLRRESGAVISPEEFKNAEQQYFAQPNEGAEVREQKRQNRLTSTKAMLAEVPDSETRVSQVRGSNSPKAPATGGKPDVGGMEAELRRRGLLK